MLLREEYPLIRVQKIQLHNILVARFNEEELRTLCFKLEDLDYDDLPGEGKQGKARELIAYLERRMRVHELVKVGRQCRPDITTWPNIIVPGEVPSTIPNQNDDQSYPFEKDFGQSNVETLILKIIDYHRATDLISNIAKLPFNSRPRAYLAGVLAQFDRDEKESSAVLETALRYMFLIFGPYEAIVRSCDGPFLKSMLLNGNPDYFPDDDADIEDIARDILRAFAIPDTNNSATILLPWSWPVIVPNSSTSLLTSSEVIHRIEETERDLTCAIDGQRFNLSSAQEIITKTWMLVENLFRFSLAYFALHFESYMPGSILGSLRKGSLEDLIESMQQVERLFTPLDDLLPEKRRLAVQLQNECRRYFGRFTPFESFDLKKYRHIVRQFDVPHNFDQVAESLQSAKLVVGGLIKSVLVPRIIVVVGKGTDNYGNSIIWFIDKQEERKTWETPTGFEWMYTTSDVTFEMFQELAMLAPDFEGEETEPLIDPVMYPIAQIEALMSINERKAAKQ